MNDSDKFSKLSQMPYREQCQFFMNGFYGELLNPEKFNDVYDFYQAFLKLEAEDKKRGEDGNELDQFWSAKFLEDNVEALPALARKEALKTIDQDNNGCMSLIEFLAWHYKTPVADVVSAPQGSDTAAIKEAQQNVERVQKAAEECQAKLGAQKAAKAENDAAVADLAAQQAELKKLEDELAAAIADLKAQEDAFAAKMAELEEKSKGGGVKGAKAANELAQMKQEDPLPLRRAKITQEAALRKVQKQQKVLQEAKNTAEAKGAALEKAIAELEASYVELEEKMAQAQKKLEEIKMRPGGGFGSLYLVERALYEADKSLPTSKQKFKHDGPFKWTPPKQ